jgi:hypothetical protein
MSVSQIHKSKAEPVTLALTDDLRARLDREALRRSLEAGRLLTRSAVARALLEQALGEPNPEAAA